MESSHLLSDSVVGKAEVTYHTGGQSLCGWYLVSVSLPAPTLPV